MSINKNGEVTLSSSGFSPDESYNMPDYEAALKSEDGVGVFHGYETGENIMAAQVEVAAEIRAHEPPVHAGGAMGHGPLKEAVRVTGICRNGACPVHARESFLSSHL